MIGKNITSFHYVTIIILDEARNDWTELLLSYWNETFNGRKYLLISTN